MSGSAQIAARRERHPRQYLTFRTVGTIVAVLVIGTIVSAAPAQAVEYPSWSDVENARANETTKKAEIGRLTTLLSSLASETAAAQSLAATRGKEYTQAQAKVDLAAYRAKALQSQATAASAVARTSRDTAGRLATQLAKFGNSDPTAQLMLSGERADDLLYRLGALGKLAERSTKVYQAAAKDANSAKALTEQATSAKNTLTTLAGEAAKSLQAATSAAAIAEAKIAQQQQNEAILQTQLAVLVENRAATEADYRKGDEIRRQQAAAAAAAEATAHPSLDSGQLSGQGWAKPASGWISDVFGPRPNKPVSSSPDFHSGTDIAAACGRPIYAATAGTVVYAGWMGGYGNWVLIEHGAGIQTGYAHIQENGVLVRVGQRVQAGQNIARVGTTGGSSGCHLHFEVHSGGARIDPQPFMRARGVTLG